MPDLADRFRSALSRSDQSRSELAVLIGARDPRAIWRLATGRRGASIEEVERLAHALRVSPGWLAFGAAPGAAPDPVLELRCRGCGARLRAVREARGLSLRALAAELGCAWGPLAAYERGEVSPPVRRLVELARALRRPASWLAYGV